MDLFGNPVQPIMPSGPVPREVHRGIIWGEREEAEFMEAVSKAFAASPKLATVDRWVERLRQDLIWDIEIRLFQRTIAKFVRKALTLVEPSEKRAFVADIKEKHGETLYRDIDSALKNEFLKKVVLESWS